MADSSRAANLAAKLVGGFLTGKPILPERTDIFVADIAFSLERYSSFIYRRWRFADAPCLIDNDGPTPVDISTLPLGFMKPPEPTMTPLRYLITLFGEQLEFVGVEVEKIKAILQERVTSFLSVRYSTDEHQGPARAVGGMVGAAPAGFTNWPTGYLKIQVQTAQSGLRIHYSPSYLIDWTNVLGAPTTPVDGWIRPGRYKFGGMRSDGTLLIDNTNWNVPPQRTMSLIF